MLTIGIELNHVVRNVNRQLLRYYQKEFDPSLEIDELDDKVDVISKYMKFKSKKQKYDFIYIDYPYEIFGCAGTSENKLAVKITNWLVNISNIEEEDIRIVFYSLNEDALTIQSTFFFLSKIGARVRKVFFPKNVKEVWEECDVVITANNQLFEEEIPEGKKVVLIDREFNKENQEKAFLHYGNLSEVIDDNNFLKQFINEER
jgi:hypothetical protein